MSRLKQSCDSTGYMWQIKCHTRTSSMTWFTAQRNLCELHSCLMQPSQQHSHPRGWQAPGCTAGSSAAAAAPPGSSQCPPTGLKYLFWENTRGDIATKETLISIFDTYVQKAGLGSLPKGCLNLILKSTVSLGSWHKTWFHPRVQLRRAHRGLGRW